MKLGAATYSYWHFTPEKTSIEHVIDEAARIGLDGVEILHRQMESEETGYMQRLKRRAFVNGLDLYALSIHQGFVSPSPETRQKNIDHTLRCIQLAHEMGIPAIRLNSGRWGTVKSFTRLMELGGIEPALDGYTESDAFEWCIGSIEKCLPHAERYGVLLALENHWGVDLAAGGRQPYLESGAVRMVKGSDGLRKTSWKSRMRNWNRSPRRRYWFTPRPTTEAASGTRWIWTIPASRRFCGAQASMAGSLLSLKARRMRIPRCRSRQSGCAKRSICKPAECKSARFLRSCGFSRISCPWP